MKNSITNLTNRLYIIIPSILLLLFTFTKNIESPYDKTIASDVVGYYAYLPAVFIYHDLNFDFTEQISANYYVDGRAGKYEFINNYKGKPVNKYWIGLSILWLPFFLVAHFLSLLFGFADDGYSYIYQYSLGVATSFYLALGIYFFKRVLANYTNSSVVILVTIISIVAGTNLFYYAVVEPGHSHVYSFTFLTIFSWLLLRFKQQDYANRKTIFWLVLIATIIVLIRPLNVFLLLFSALLILELKGSKNLLLSVFSDKKAVGILLIPFAFLFLQLALWHKQTGFWLVDSYSGESFNLNNPHFFDFLFSFKKGWLLYTPICLFSFGGIVLHYKKNSKSMAVAFAILLAWIYLLSSWWIWTYGTSFGQRLMIDSYPILGIFLVLFFQWFYSKSKYLLIVVCCFFISLNLFQTWQQKHGILPSYFVSKNIYKQSFFSTQKHAYALYSDDLILNRLKKQYSISDNHFVAIRNTDNDAETLVFKGVQYSTTINETIPKDYLYGIIKIVFEASISANQKNTNASIVIDISRNDSSILYQKFDIKEFIVPHRYQKMNFLIDAPNKLIFGDKLRAYLYNPTAENDTIKMKNVSIEFLRMLKDE